MNRYVYASIDQPTPHIFPNQVWKKKSYPNEAILVVSYCGNDYFQCIPWIKTYQQWQHGGSYCSIDITKSDIMRYYELLQTF